MDEKKNSWHSIIINRQAISKLQYKYARKSIQSYTVHGDSPLELILNFLFDENYIMREINAIITTARHISSLKFIVFEQELHYRWKVKIYAGD